MTYEVGELAPIKRYWIARNGNIPQRFWGHEFSDIEKFTGKLPKEATEWVEHALNGFIIKKPGEIGSTGVGLLFDGKPGRGKTTTAVTAAMEFVRKLPDDPEEARKILYLSPTDYGMKTRVIYYLTMPDFLGKKKAVFDADIDERRELNRELEGFYGRSKDDYLNVRILILDDLGKEYGSEYDKFSFDDILRARYDKGLPTVLTTNKSRELWASAYSEAMASFAHEAFTRVKLIGDDLRRPESE